MSGPSTPYPHLTNLLSERLGARALFCSDDFFASIHNLVRDEAPSFDPTTYDACGKVMDGWESRRKRGPGHDWCILKLAVPGTLRAVDIDTHFFTGNHAPYASLEACNAASDATETALQHATWTEILPPRALTLGSHNLLPIQGGEDVYTHVRLNIFPDGGVARLRLYGEVQVHIRSTRFDLAALVNGGKAVACSDMYFGVMDNLIAPGRAHDMREGWETRRRRGAGEDWVILRLAQRGVVDELLLDTNHFKGNYPDTVVVEGLDWDGATTPMLLDADWNPLLPATKLQAHEERSFKLHSVPPFTHLRMRIAPCGGVSRLRAFGTPAPEDSTVVPYLNSLREEQAFNVLMRCCGSSHWARQVAQARPYASFGALRTLAHRVWWTASEQDWREAFSHHPRIGEDASALRKKYATASLSAAEQAGIEGASEQTLLDLLKGNQAYEAKFSHVFLVCATGKSATEMLEILNRRLPNTPERELREAANQQAKITDLRLAGVHQ